jgi:hypothetical protein
LLAHLMRTSSSWSDDNCALAKEVSTERVGDTDIE